MTQRRPNIARNATASLAVLLSLLVVTCPVRAVESESLTPQQTDFFEKKVRPVLAEHCYECHSAEAKKSKGGLVLDSKVGWETGGDAGPALIPGDVEQSLLTRAITHKDNDLQMPPKYRMKDHEIAALRAWVEMGAPDPRTGGVAAKTHREIDLDAGRQFWSFKPRADAKPPAVKHAEWPAGDIDRFILAALEAKGLTPAPLASPEALVRRIYIDLTGLPPTPEQIDAFVADPSPEAYARLVDELLASPRFGERWGRHWLDVTRFAESSGGGRSLMFKDAWRFRDYVIESFNNEKPFDQLIREHIAGDLLPYDNHRERNDNLIGAGYLILGPHSYEQQDKALLKMDIVDEQISVVGSTFLGMTLGCVRCHEHKFDPIPMEDYYALAGIFQSTDSVTPGNVSGYVQRPLSGDEQLEKELAAYNKKIDELTLAVEQAKKDYQIVARESLPAEKGKLGPIRSRSLPGIVIDDVDAEQVGYWMKSTHNKNYVDATYIHDQGKDRGRKSVVFKPKIEIGGKYEVRLAYNSSSNRASNVPVIIDHQDGRDEVIVNQVKRPPIDGYFVSLGTYRFEADNVAQVTVTNKGTNGVVIADAVQFLPIDADNKVVAKARGKKTGSIKDDLSQFDKLDFVPFIVEDPSTLEGVVVDDIDAEKVGEWKHSVHTPPFVGKGYLHDAKTGKGAKSMTFRPTLPAAGEYEVRLAHNYNVRRTTTAPVTVHHADGKKTIIVNEREPSPIKKLWVSLGKFRFEKGRSGKVVIETHGTDGAYVIADAVQFIPLEAAGVAKADRGPNAAELKKRYDKLSKQLKELKKKSPKPKDLAMSVRDMAKPADGHLHIRGQVRVTGKKVPRGFLTVATPPGEARPKIADGESGRRELADWVADPDNPLTARVMANRVWLKLLGEGIVRTPDNFGFSGRRPSHPELLDYLANAFVDNGWSVKKLIRQIVLSKTYRLSTVHPDADAIAKVDAENALLAYAHRRRLDAEVIRDSILQVSGKLDLAMGGLTIRKFSKYDLGYDHGDIYRRSVYVPAFRNTLLEIFEIFDYPNPNLVTGRRTASTIAPQSLYLMNSPFVIDQSRLAAARLINEVGSNRSAWIERAYRQVLGRRPSQDERLAAERYVSEYDGKDEDALASLYHTLFASLDFRYLN